MSPGKSQTILLAACLATLALGLYVLYRMARIARGIATAIREERRVKPQMDHSALGRMTLHKPIWSGEYERGDRKLAFYVPGSLEGPSPNLLPAILRILEDSDDTTRSAIEYLIATQSKDPLLSKRKLDPDMFKLESMGCIDENSPEEFALEFELDGEPNGVWRVEFKNGTPVFSGYED